MCTTNKRRDRIKQKNNNNPKGDEKQNNPLALRAKKFRPTGRQHFIAKTYGQVRNQR